MLKAFSLSLWDAYLHSICNLQPKSSAVKPLTLGCLFTQHMQPTAQKLCQAFYLWMLIHKAYAAYSPKTLSSLLLVDAYSHSIYAAYSPEALSSLLLVDAYSQSICSLQSKNSVKPFTCGCLFTKHMQPTAPKLCQAFYLWMLIHTAYMQPTAQKLCQAFHLWMLIHKAKAYALIHKAYAAYSPKTLSSLLLVDAYSQSICSLQPKNSVKPFTCGCLFTKHMQPTAQKLSQAFYMWMLIHKVKACAAYSPKALQSNLSSKLEYHIQP